MTPPSDTPSLEWSSPLLNLDLTNGASRHTLAEMAEPTDTETAEALDTRLVRNTTQIHTPWASHVLRRPEKRRVCWSSAPGSGARRGCRHRLRPEDSSSSSQCERQRRGRFQGRKVLRSRRQARFPQMAGHCQATSTLCGHRGNMKSPRK